MPKNFGGHVTMATPPFEKTFGGHVRTVPGNTCVKFELTVLKLLAVIAQKFRGSRDHGHAPFWGNFWGHVWIVPGNTCVKFEVRSSDRFGVINI